MPSPTYRLFAQAMAERKQIVCDYGGFTRELCPVVLGHTDGGEVALTYQFAGGSSTRLPPDGDWKCFRLAKVSRARLRAGPWHTGIRHGRRQQCVEDVDLDVNPTSPYRPRRRLDG
jgi:hypothetical protein